MNLFAYLSANPLSARDPLGLDIWDDCLDDATADWTGQRLYALGKINDAASAIALGLRRALDIAGALLGIDVFKSVVVLAHGRGGFWDGVNIALAATPIGRLAKTRSKAVLWGKALRKASKGWKSLKHASICGVKPYKPLRKELAGKGLRAHHVIEIRLDLMIRLERDSVLLVSIAGLRT